MSRTKVRKIEYRPDEYIAGVGAVLGAEEQAVYWMACTLMMSRGGPIDEDPQRLAHLCKLRPSKVRRILDALVIKHEKLVRIGGKLAHDRVEYDLEKSRNRIESATENGHLGGRPPNKINALNEPGGSENDKANHQPATHNDLGGGGRREATVMTWAGDPDAAGVVVWFEDRRLALWPTESALPAPRLTQLSQVRGYLDQGISPAALTELIERQLARRVEQGHRAPNSINAFCRSLPEAIAQALAAQKQPVIPAVAPGASNAKRPDRHQGHANFIAAAAGVITDLTGVDPRDVQAAGGESGYVDAARTELDSADPAAGHGTRH